jgi:hypothetical protein
MQRQGWRIPGFIRQGKNYHHSIDISEAKGMDVDHAITAHARLHTSLQAAIEAQQLLDAATVERHHLELNRWLCGSGRKLHGSQPEFISLLCWNDAFQLESARVADAIREGKFEDARQMTGYGSPFSRASSAVNISVNRLKSFSTLGLPGAREAP